MKDILIYALGVVVCSGVFVAFYRTVMHRRTSFRTARVFLIASLVAAAVIPAFDIPVWRSEPVVLPAFEFTPAVTPTVISEAPVDIWPAVMLGIYGLGIAMLITLMVVQTFKIRRTKRRAEVYATHEYEVAVSEEVSSPFSFLQTVYVTRGTPPNEMQQIILHEASHIRHRHSVEKIFMETLKTLLWFNPFAWIAARLLNEVQEFEADRDVLLGGCTVEEYLPVIFRQVFGYAPEISTGLNHSLTKKRFEMMTTKLKHTKFSWLRTVGAVPLVTAMMMLFGFTHRAPEVVTQEPRVSVVTTVTTGPKQVEQTDTPVNVVTVRSRDGKSGKEVNDYKNIIIWLANENREITKTEMNAIAPENIESVSVLKEPASMKLYIDKTGRESVDGVIVITKKSGGSKSIISEGTARKLRGSAGPDKSIQVSALNIRKAGTSGIEKELSLHKSNVFFWLLNEEKEISKEEVNAIDPNLIDELLVLKGEGNYPNYMRRAMGNREFDSAVLIGLKKTDVAQNAPVYKADEMPKFEGGGLNDFRYWIMKRIIYPKNAVEKKIQGRVTLKFVIEGDGSISNIEALSSPDPSLTDEAIRVMKLSPKWTPGKQDGKPVRVSFVLPIDFSLKGTTATEVASLKVTSGEKTTVHSSKIRESTDTVGDTPKDKMFYWLTDEGRKLTAKEMKILDANGVKSVSVEKYENFYIGDRKFAGVVQIRLKE
jgi:TonB family protein